MGMYFVSFLLALLNCDLVRGAGEKKTADLSHKDESRTDSTIKELKKAFSQGIFKEYQCEIKEENMEELRQGFRLFVKILCDDYAKKHDLKTHTVFDSCEDAQNKLLTPLENFDNNDKTQQKYIKYIYNVMDVSKESFTNEEIDTSEFEGILMELSLEYLTYGFDEDEIK